MALGGVSEWFDDYIAGEEADPGDEPELHKGMVRRRHTLRLPCPS